MDGSLLGSGVSSGSPYEPPTSPVDGATPCEGCPYTGKWRVFNVQPCKQCPFKPALNCAEVGVVLLVIGILSWLLLPVFLFALNG